MLNNQRVYKLSKKRTEDAIDKKDLTLGCAAPLTGKKACIRLVSQPQLMVGFEVLTPWLVDLHVQWPLWGNKRPFPETSKHHTLLAGLYIYIYIYYIHLYMFSPGIRVTLVPRIQLDYLKGVDSPDRCCRTL
jgi:hypothetical protein